MHAGGTTTGGDEFFLGHGVSVHHQQNLPDEKVIQLRVGPALEEAIKTGSWGVQRDALIALAKLHPIYTPKDGTIVDVLTPYLASGNQSVADAAILALGLTGDFLCVGPLTDIAADNERGQALISRESVPSQTRALAAFSLGNLGDRLNNEDARRILVGGLGALLHADEGARPDLHMACVTAIGMTPLPETHRGSTAQPASKVKYRASSPTAHRSAQIQFLVGLLQDETRHEVVRAHIPRAIANIAKEASNALRDDTKRELLAELNARKRSDRLVRYGIVEALGMLGDSDNDAIDKKVRAALHESISASDNSQRGLALIALALTSSRRGQVAEPFASLAKERAYLMYQITRGRSSLKPWSALALGLQNYHSVREDQPASKNALRALLQSYKETRNPTRAGAWSIALGLTGDPKARAEVEKRMIRHGDDNARGFAAVALGLLRDPASASALQSVVDESEFHPIAFRKASVGLALLGQQSTSMALVDKLRGKTSSSLVAATVGALGLIGDIRVMEPLLDVLQNEEQLDSTRGFSAVAMGIICETERYPWRAQFTSHLNYFAITESLYSANGTGILNMR